MSSLNQFFPFNNNLVRRFLNWKPEDEEQLWRQKAIEALSAKLKKQPNHQFSKLQLALDKKSRDTPCVLLPRSQDGRLQVLHKKLLPHVMCCRIFRWPDLQSHHELKSLSSCQYAYQRREGPDICVNPYHYSRVEHVPIYSPPVITDKEIKPHNVSLPSQSPLSPGSNYCTGPQYQGIPNYFSTITTPPNQIFSSQPHQQENPINYMRTTEQSYYPNQLPLSEPNNWYGGLSPAYEQQSPPPVYTRHDPRQMALMPVDAMEDTQQTDQTFMGSDDGFSKPWCRIAYSELNQFVGAFLGSSRKVIVDGYSDTMPYKRFCLCQLSSVNPSGRIERTRSFIGKGICLEDNDGQIYVENLSEHPIFFHSKIRNVEDREPQNKVLRVPTCPGGPRKDKIFDQRVFEGLVQEALRSENAYEELYSLGNQSSIRMSFVKGWGGEYKAPDITSTPCWIEIQLLRPLDLIDPHLQRLKPSTFVTSTS